MAKERSPITTPDVMTFHTPFGYVLVQLEQNEPRSWNRVRIEREGIVSKWIAMDPYVAQIFPKGVIQLVEGLAFELWRVSLL